MNAPGVTVNKLTYTGPTNLTINLSVAASAPESEASLTVTNPDGQSATSATGILFVGLANKAPTISDIADVAVNEDTPTPPLHFTVTDKETPAGSLTVTVSSSNPVLVPPGGVNLGGSGSDRTLVITPAFDQFGSAIITVTVRDAGGKEARDTFVLTVNPVNDPPTLEPLSDLILDEDAPPQTVGLAGIGSGAANEAQGFTVRATSSNPSLIPNPAVTYHSPDATGSLTFSSAPDSFGTAVITVTVDDGQTENREVRRTFTATVKPVNDPPVLSSIPDQETDEDAPRNVSLQVSDLETPAGLLTVRAQSANPALLPDSNLVVTGSGTARSLVITPATNQFGSTIVTVTVRDAEGAEAERKFRLTVRSLNDPPTLTGLSDTTVNEDTAAVVTFTVADAETPLGDLVVTASSSDAVLAPPENLKVTGQGAVRTLTVTPGTNAFGSTRVLVSVRDAEGGMVSQGFTLNVNPVDDLQTISDTWDQTSLRTLRKWSIQSRLGTWTRRWKICACWPTRRTRRWCARRTSPSLERELSGHW